MGQSKMRHVSRISNPAVDSIACSYSRHAGRGKEFDAFLTVEGLETRGGRLLSCRFSLLALSITTRNESFIRNVLSIEHG